MATKSATDKLRKSRKRVFYKVVSKGRKSAVFGGGLASPVHYRKGRWACSNATWKRPDKLSFSIGVATGAFGSPITPSVPVRKMTKGVYVYCKRPHKQDLWDDQIIIKVHAEPQDLIGATCNVMFPEDDKACFTKVKVLT